MHVESPKKEEMKLKSAYPQRDEVSQQLEESIISTKQEIDAGKEAMRDI